MPKQSSDISIDSKNRVIITETFKDASKVGRNVRSVSSGGVKTLRKIAVDGTWSMTEGHDLKIKVSGLKSSYAGKTIVLQGEIKKVTGTRLIFGIRESDTVTGLRTRSIELNGRWQADKNNRITFAVKKSNGRSDVLRFQGAWSVGERNELIYRYVKTSLKKGEKFEKALVFKGYWDLARHRLTYRIEGSNKSYFEFSASIGTKSLRASSGVIKYQVGIKYKKSKVFRQVRRVVSIYGAWKFGKDLSVRFEATASGKKYTALSFTAEKPIGRGNTVAVALKAKDGENLGVDVTFTKEFSKDAEVFLNLSRHPNESRVMGGVRIKF